MLNVLFSRFADMPTLRTQQRARMRHPLNTCAMDGSPNKGGSNGVHKGVSDGPTDEDFQIKFEQIRSLFAIFIAVVVVGTTNSRRCRNVLEWCACKGAAVQLEGINKCSSQVAGVASSLNLDKLYVDSIQDVGRVARSLEAKANARAQHVDSRIERDHVHYHRSSPCEETPQTVAASPGRLRQLSSGIASSTDQNLGHVVSRPSAPHTHSEAGGTMSHQHSEAGCTIREGAVDMRLTNTQNMFEQIVEKLDRITAQADRIAAQGQDHNQRSSGIWH